MISEKRTLKDIFDALCDIQETKVTQKQVADSLCMNVSTLNRILNGQTELTVAVAQDLADYFHVSLDVICGNCDVPEFVSKKKAPDTHPLNMFALNWLYKNKERHPERIDMINSILENQSLADSFVDAIYKFAMSEFRLVDSTFESQYGCDSKILATTLLSEGLDECFMEIRRMYIPQRENILKEKSDAILKQFQSSLNELRKKRLEREQLELEEFYREEKEFIAEIAESNLKCCS